MIETLTGTYKEEKPWRTLSFFVLVTASYALLFAGVAIASVFAQRVVLAVAEPATIINLSVPLQVTHAPTIKEGGGVRRGNPQSSNADAASEQRRPSPAELVSIPFLPPAPGTSPRLPSTFTPAGIPGGSEIGSSGTGPWNGGGDSLRPVPPTEPVEAPRHDPVRLKSEIIVGKASRQVRPEYPELVRRAHIQGSVQVEITVNEAGRVISARPLGGPPLLFSVSVDAAKQWLFAPTLLNGHPVPVRGVITFNFVLN